MKDPPSAEEQIECLERAINEVDALQAIYGTDHDGGNEVNDDGGSSVVILSKSQLATARSIINGEGGISNNDTVPTLELRVQTPLENGTIVSLKCTLPPGYPQVVPATVSPSIDGIRRKLRDELSDKLNEKAKSMVGFESIMELVEELKELGVSYLQQEEELSSKSKGGGKTSTNETEKSKITLYAVVEFHHMLIGNSHKKEAAALNAADGIIRGFIYMGGPSCAVVEAAKEDLLSWLTDCKKAGKEGVCTYWRVKEKQDNETASLFGNKLKVMPYAPGKDNKMDTTAYRQTLEQLNVPFPLPECPYLQ